MSKSQSSDWDFSSKAKFYVQAYAKSLDLALCLDANFTHSPTHQPKSAPPIASKALII